MHGDDTTSHQENQLGFSKKQVRENLAVLIYSTVSSSAGTVSPTARSQFGVLAETETFGTSPKPAMSYHKCGSVNTR